MRILFCQPVYHVNQVGFTKELIKRGHEIKFVVRRDAYNLTERPVEPIIQPYSPVFQKVAEVTRFPRWAKNILGYPPLAKSSKIIREFNPDVVVARNYHVYAAIYAILANATEAQFILYVQDPKYTNSPSRIKKKIEQIYEILFNEALQRYTPVLGEGAERNNTKYIPFAINPEHLNDINNKPWFKNDKTNIVTIGRFDERKNHKLLIECMNQLTSEYDFSLTIIGGNLDPSNKVYSELQSMVKDYNIEDVVEFTGRLSNKKVIELLYQSDLYILPSYDEPAGYSHLEAMSQGLPVICSDTNGTKHYINHKINGYVFESENEKDLVRAIQYCCSNRDKLTQMGEESRKIIEQDHVPELVVDRFEEMVN